MDLKAGTPDAFPRTATAPELFGQPRIIIGLGVAWLALECFAFGPYSFLEQQDTGNLFVPMLHAVGRGGSDVGDWYPLAGGGLDLLASGMFVEPFVSLFRFLPTWIAYALLTLASAGFGAFGVYALGRRALGLSPEIAAMSGVAFAAIPGASSIYGFGLTVFPAYLFALRYAALGDGTLVHRSIVAFSASFGFALVIEPQFLMPFPFLWVGLWFTLVEPLRRPTRWLMLVLAALVTLVPHIEQIISLLENGPLSSRYGIAPAGSYGEILADAVMDLFGVARRLVTYVEQPIRLTEISEPARNVILFLAYGIAIAGIMLARSTWTRAFRLLGVLAAAWLICAAVLVVQKAARTSFPLLAGYGLTRIRSFDMPIYVLLFGLGIQGLVEASRRNVDEIDRRIRKIGIALLVIGFFVFSGAQKIRNAVAYLAETGRRYAASSEQLAALAQRVRGEEMPVRIMTIRFSPNWLAYHPGLEAAGAYQSIVLKRYQEISTLWRRPEAGLSWRQGALWEIDFIIDADPDGVVRLDRVARLDLLSLSNVHYIVSPDPVEGAHLTRIDGDAVPWSLLGTKERVARRLSENAHGAKSFFIYRNDAALPRFFVAHKTRSFGSDDEMLAALAAGSAEDFRKAAYVRDGAVPETFDHSSGASSGAVRVISYGADRIELDVLTEQKGLLVITNSYSPLWRATVNGEPVPYVPAYHAFSAVGVGAGSSRVVLRYEPTYSAWRR